MNKIRFFTLLTAILILIFSFSTTALAVSMPKPSESFYVYDEADVISEETESYIISQNDKLFYSTGSQIVFAVLKELPENISIRDYTKALYSEWSIADTDTQNGVLVLMYIAEDHKNDDYWVIQGVGIDDELTSSKIKSMTESYLEPYFGEQDYDKGARTLFDKLVIAIADICDVDLDKVTLPDGGVDPYGNPKSSGSAGTVIITVIIVIVVLAILITAGLIIFRNISSRNYRRRNYKPSVMIPPGAKRNALPPRTSSAPRGNMPRQSPNMQRPASGNRRPNPNMQRPNPNTQRPNPNVARPNPGMQRQNPNVQRPNPNAQRPNPNMQRPNPGQRNIQR